MIMIQINPEKQVRAFVWAIEQKEKTIGLQYIIIKYKIGKMKHTDLHNSVLYM